MAERNNPYKLTVVADSEGEFLVGHYSKIDLEKVPDLPGVIRRMAYYSSRVLNAQPTYVDLTESDQLIVETVRSALLERDRLISQLSDVRLKFRPRKFFKLPAF